MATASIVTETIQHGGSPITNEPNQVNDESAMAKEGIKITVEFSGGLELLFNKERAHEIVLPARKEDGSVSDIASLLIYLVENTMTDDRKDMFISQGSVRPGVLVLINDADWELSGEDTYELKAKDHILFVSTLHGG